MIGHAAKLRPVRHPSSVVFIEGLENRNNRLAAHVVDGFSHSFTYSPDAAAGKPGVYIRS